MATYPVSIAVLILAMALISIGGAGYLRVIHRWGNVDAYLAAAPGGMSQVLALGAELGGDLRAIAIVQSIRVVVIAVGLPAGLSMLGLVGHAPPRVTGALSIGVLDELAILVAASTVVAIIAYRIRFPGGLLFGAMLTSAALHGSGLIHAVMPWWVVNTRDGRDGRYYWLAFRQHAAAHAVELCRCCLRLLCCCRNDRCCVCGSPYQRAVAACRRSDDCLRARLGRRDDAAGARAQPRSGLCGRPPSDANLFRVADHAASGAAVCTLSQNSKRAVQAIAQATTQATHSSRRSSGRHFRIDERSIRPRPPANVVAVRAVPIRLPALQPGRRSGRHRGKGTV